MGCEARKRSGSPGPSPVECSNWTLYTYPEWLGQNRWVSRVIHSRAGITSPASLEIRSGRPIILGHMTFSRSIPPAHYGSRSIEVASLIHQAAVATTGWQLGVKPLLIVL